MIRMEGRFEVKLINAQAFASYMKFRGFTVRSLADRLGCSHSVIGHLRSGKRKNCDPDLAKAICRLLDAPLESFFVPNVSYVAREVSPRKVAV